MFFHEISVKKHHYLINFVIGVRELKDLSKKKVAIVVTQSIFQKNPPASPQTTPSVSPVKWANAQKWVIIF